MADEDTTNPTVTGPAISPLPQLPLATTDTSSKLYAVVRFPDDDPETIEIVCQCWITGAKDEMGRSQCYMPTGRNYLNSQKKLKQNAYTLLLNNYCLPPETNGWEFDLYPCFIERGLLGKSQANRTCDEVKKSGRVHHLGKVESDLDKSNTDGPAMKRVKKSSDGQYFEAMSTDSGEESTQLPNPAVCLISFYLFQQFFQKNLPINSHRVIEFTLISHRFFPISHGFAFLFDFT